MATIHGSNTVITLDSTDLSAYCNTSEIKQEYDTHDTTGYGASGHAYDPGLEDSTISIGGIYDSTAGTGPRAKIKGVIGTAVTFIRQPEGTGAGLPQDSATVIVKSYTETAPVADMVKWSADMVVDGVIDDTAQAS
jgi:hypothetical protein